MARRVFFSFHYELDCWRTNQVRHMGMLEGNEPCTPNEWEAIWRRGDSAVKAWIDDQMRGRSCLVVLIGRETANRPWVRYEISKAWEDGKGVVGVYVHRLKDQHKLQSTKGPNPFARVMVPGTHQPLSDRVTAHDPEGWFSTDVYRAIEERLGGWIDEAIEARSWRHWFNG